MASSSLPPALTLPPPFDPTARRVEIDEFIADNVLTNLFLLALKEMKETPIHAANDPAEDWFSFYNLSEIHGFPFEHWRGVSNKPPRVSTSGFYCTHGSTVFPTWHRLYIHMFEQAVYRKMQQVANTFQEPEKSSHIAALSRYRFPYWDPCLPRVALQDGQTDVADMFDMPEILKVTEVHVMTPQGPKSIPNPLRSFTFPTAQQYKATGRAVIDWQNQSGLSPSIAGIASYGHRVTTRTPATNGHSDDALFTAEMRESYYKLSTDFFTLLHPDRAGGPQPWAVFANHFVLDDQGKPTGDAWPENTSLESWHDNIHGLVGSGDSIGHMTVVPVAAFDPIFWLHHNNIDRMFALYQAMYDNLPDKFVPDTLQPGNQVTANSELAPFVKIQTATEQVCYTSNDIRDWTNLGFAVPGTKPLDQAGRDGVAQYIMNVYEWASERIRPKDTLGYPRDVSGVFALSGKNFDPEASKPVEFLALSKSKVVKQSFSSKGEKLAEHAVDAKFHLPTQDMARFPKGSFIDREHAKMRTWSVLMRVRKYAFRASFNVQIFIGPTPSAEEGANFFVAPQQANFSSVFAFDPDSECDNCSINRNMIYGDVISITPKLKDYLQANQAPGWPSADLRTLESLEPQHVVPFLSKHLEWTIVMPDGRVVSQQEIADSHLELLVADSVYEYPIESANTGPLGRYGPFTHHPEVTAGKTGGYRGATT